MDTKKQPTSTTSATQWETVDALDDDAIHRAINNDPDSHLLTDIDFQHMRPATEVLPKIFKPSNTVPTVLNLSPEVLAYFQAKGQSWQTQIDNILKQYIAQH